jgi:hypothetical protein
MLIIGFLFVLIMLLFIFSSNSVEGMATLGKYTYLSPVAPESKWSQDVITKFVDEFNKKLGLDEKSEFRLNAQTFATDRSSNTFMQEILEEEAKYYIMHGKWPYCHYVSDYLNNNPTVIPANAVQYGITITQTNVSNILSNRQVYNQFISSMEAKLDPQPESFKIFKGSQAAPLPSSSESSTSLTGSDYTKLKDICKNVKA